MEKTQLDAGFSRRDSLRLASTGILALVAESYAFGASDFWNKKKAAEWTDQEKEELRTKSPWAKKVDPESSGGGGRGGAGGGGADGESSGRGGGGGGGGGGSRRGGGGGGGGLVPAVGGGAQAPLFIVWESAKPIQEAHPLALPSKLDNHYVIAVTGISQQTLNAVMMGRGGRGGGRNGGGGGQDGANPAPPPDVNPGPPDPTAGLRRGATLAVKGKDPQNAAVVLAMNNNATVLFGFPKDVLALSAADKEAEFDLKLGSMSAKAKFTLKDMMYGEELAL